MKKAKIGKRHNRKKKSNSGNLLAMFTLFATVVLSFWIFLSIKRKSSKGKRHFVVKSGKITLTGNYERISLYF